MALDPVTPSVRLGASQQFTVTGTFADQSTQDLTHRVHFTATDIAPAQGVASIDASGLATGGEVGESLITAHYQDLAASTRLTVVDMLSGFCSTGGWCWRNPLPQGNVLRGAWAACANDAWAVGDFGTIIKWNGSAWAVLSGLPASNLTGVWGSGAASVWAVGIFGNILEFDPAQVSPKLSVQPGPAGPGRLL